MAEHDSDPLSAEERAELEQLRAEKAARVAEEKARRERAELEALRAEKSRAEKAAKSDKSPQTSSSKSSARPATKTASKSSSNSSARSTGASKPASKKAAESPQKREDMSFAVRMVTATEPKDEDDIPGMAPAQKIIIVLALIAFAVFIGYSVINSTGALG